MPTLFSTVLHKNINRLQRVQNTLARVTASHAPPQDTHTSGILKHLHWLPIEQCIKFKLATLTHNTLCSTHPAYLHSLLNYHTPTTRSLCSANANLLSVPCVLTIFASRGFTVAAPIVWNSLQFDIHDSSSTHTFHRLLKTHCYQQAFSSPSGSPMCLRFASLADTVHSKHSFTYLLTYLNVIYT